MKKNGRGKRFGGTTKIEIVYEDRDLLVADKPAGLLTIDVAGQNKFPTVSSILTNYVRKGAARSTKRLYLVHRLDRDTTGVIIFAKTDKAKNTLKNNWKDVKKTYYAIVHGRFEKKEGEISSYLTARANHLMHSVKDAKGGSFALTKYKVLRESNAYSLLEIDLKTGKRNQIRVHMMEAGHSIVGDDTYGKRGDRHEKLALHAGAIKFKHPFDKRNLSFCTKVPKFFESLLPMPNDR